MSVFLRCLNVSCWMALALVLMCPCELCAQIEYFNPVRVGTISDTRIDELSGMVSVTGRSEIYWAHNDSKNSESIFAVRQDGQVIAEVTLTGTKLNDWEDIGKGPGPVSNRTYLYIADSGNNNRSREILTLLRFPEPELVGVQPGQRLTQAVEEFKYRYPDGLFDSEALVVHPLRGDIYVLTKIAGTAGVYKFPPLSSKEMTLERLGGLRTSNLITAADVSSDGLRLLIRTYSQILEFQTSPLENFDDIFFGDSRILPSAASETKSESICFDHFDLSYLTTNEGNPAPINMAFPRTPQEFCDLELADDSIRIIKRGDVVEESGDLDRLVNVTDAVGVVDTLSGDLTLDCLDAADIDDDGLVDPGDVSELLSRLSRGLALRAPFRSPGLDETSDALACGEESSRVLVDQTVEWQYWYGALSPVDDWKTANRLDLDWLAGAGGIGFGSPEVGTRIPGSPTQTVRLLARREFIMSGDLPGDLPDGLVLELDYNDGVIVYLNGIEVARRNLGLRGFEVPPEFPGQTHGGGGFEDLLLCADPLRDGVNVLAVELHNRSLSDPTLFFRAALRGFDEPRVLPPPSVSPALSNAVLDLRVDRSLNVGDAASIHVYAQLEGSIRALSLYFQYSSFQARLHGVTAAPSLNDAVWQAMNGSVLGSIVSYAMVIDPDGVPGGSLDSSGEMVHIADIEILPLRTGFLTFSFRDRNSTTVPLRNTLVSGERVTYELEPVEFRFEVSETREPLIETLIGNSGFAGKAFFVVGKRFDEPGLTVTICGREAEFELLADDQTIRAISPTCDVAGPALLEVCTSEGCDSREEGFIYNGGEPMWIRADANGDATVDISDAVALLGFLFLGTAIHPVCDDALDTNADDKVDVSDPVFVLSYLFHGGPAMPAPFPDAAPCR